MWKKLLLWLGKAIVKAAAEQVATTVAEKRAQASAAQAEAQRLMALAAQAEAEAKALQEGGNPLDALKQDA